MASFSLDDLINLEPSKVSRDLTGYITYLYGEPKVGKTTFARDMGALILACEDGTRAMSGAYAKIMKSWSDIKTIARFAKDQRMKDRYKAIAIDTVDIAGSLCEKYVCSQLDIQTLGEGGWAKNGWATFKKEFEETFRSLANEGYAVVFISHSKDKEFTRPDGTKYNKIIPTASESISSIIRGMSDLIIYGYQEMGTDKRYMICRSDGSIEAGGRFAYIKPKIPFGYQSLMDALNDAIDEQEKHEGAETVTNERRKVNDAPELNYDAIMEEFKTIVEEKMTANAAFFQPKITFIIEKYLGRGKKFSEATPDQVEQMSLIIDELKEL